MKKYILGIMIAGLSIIGISNAGNINITRTSGNPQIQYMEGNYNPSTITIKENIETENLIKNYTCENFNCVLKFIDGCRIEGYNNSQGLEYEGCGDIIQAGEYTIVDNGNIGFSSITINDGENIKEGIVNGGIEAFSGIIEKLGSIFGEFGPYIIYIAIACLGISLLFKALKYILGFTNNSAKNSIGGRQAMKERRTRRRRNRRLQRYIYRNERGRNGETYDQKYKKQYKNNMKFGSRGYNSRK